MSKLISLVMVLGLAALGCGASSSTFVSSWRAPDAAPLEFRNSKVAAVVMMKNPASRRAAEDALAQEISKRGAQGVPMYTLLEDAHLGDDEATRAALEAAQVKGIVAMRPVSTDKEVVATPSYSGPAYGGYYGGYHSYGWGTSWGGQVYTNTIVSVETLVYSLEQNKLVWGGQSKTTNPENVDALVKELAEAVAEELQKQRLISGG
jgi:hypothetical protein